MLERDYVWVKGSGVLWKTRDGALRRAQFTHGTYFRTERGEFYIDSDGSVRELLRAEATEGESSHEGETVARQNPGEEDRGGGEEQGGIIIPDTAKEKPQEGKVVAVGKGEVSDNGKVLPLEVKKGDQMLFSKYAGNEIEIGGDEHMIMREDDVLAIRSRCPT